MDQASLREWISWETPLHIAVEAGDTREVARLIAAGAAVDAGNYRMYTPLHVAAGIAASEVVAVLLTAGANAGALTVFGDTPLHRAAHGLVGAADARVEIIDRLLAAGCPLNAVDTAGRTALWYAAGTGTTPWTPDQQATRFRVLQHLLDRGADPSIAARGTQGRPIDAARGLHQAKKDRQRMGPRRSATRRPRTVTACQLAGARIAACPDA